MTNFFKTIQDKFKTVYCEDCKYAHPNDTDFWKSDPLMCEKCPISVDYTEATDFVTRKTRKIAHSYIGCNRAKKHSFCFKFESKE